jgi:hypothetical protein
LSKLLEFHRQIGGFVSLDETKAVEESKQLLQEDHDGQEQGEVLKPGQLQNPEYRWLCNENFFLICH